VERRESRPRAGEWHLTEAGRALAPVIQQLSEWGLRYAQIPLRETDLDVTVMMWNMKRRVDPKVFSARRTIIQFDFTDMPENHRRWWLVNEGSAVDLCVFDPGFPIDVSVTTDMPTMIAIWFGRLTWDAGVRSGKVEVTGPRQLRDRLPRWFLLSPIAPKRVGVPLAAIS
jgi:HxlR-like helix-turn-helix